MTIRVLRAAAAACASSVAAAAHAGWFDDKVTEPFLVPPIVADAQLSPDGRLVATILVDGEQRTGLAMIDAVSGEGKITIQADVKWTSADAGYWRGPRRIAWIDDALLAVEFNDDTAKQVNLDGAVVGNIGYHYLGQFKPKGSDQKWIVASRDKKSLRVVRLPRASRDERNFGSDLDIDGDTVDDWLTDADGSMRVVRMETTAKGADKTRIATWYRKAADAPWQRIDDREITDDEFQPVLVGSEPGRLVVQAYNGGDHLAMWNFDVERKVFDDLAAGHPSEDIVGIDADTSTRTFTRVATDGLKPQTVWFEPRMAALQAAVDRSLPGHVNRIADSQGDTVLIHSYSDVDPGVYYVLNKRTMAMHEVSHVRPNIDPARMQPMQALHYPSFDGLSIPAYLTLPGKPAGPVPLIVLIHGGPQARDRWQWQQDVQVYAAHGYAVFQPQFRGSTGFGRKFEQAGYGQWGQAMQDDITAGVHWLIDRKIADPQRICIVGASYGGYAALWGLVKTPELYKCGVSYAGVSDLEHMLDDDSDRTKHADTRELMRDRIGDPTLMKATWDSVSPLKHADRIQAPVLILHGAKDERVPISHGKQMVEALKAAHKDVRWIEFEDERHSLGRIENQRKWYDEVLSLLRRTIGKGVPPEVAP